MAAFFFVLHAAGWKYGQELAPQDPLYLQATTACLSAIIVMQIVNVFLCRSASRSVFSTGLLGNPLILWGVALEIALVLVINYTPWGNSLLGTSPVVGPVWLLDHSFRGRHARPGRIAQMACPRTARQAACARDRFVEPLITGVGNGKVRLKQLRVQQPPSVLCIGDVRRTPLDFPSEQ